MNAIVNATPERRLMDRNEVIATLQLPEADVQWLIDTQQLTEIRLRGHQRFDSKDVYSLIDSYKTTSKRRVQ